jgi:SAM-dependent methyltransferase
VQAPRLLLRSDVMDLTRREALAMAALLVPGLAEAGEPTLEVPYVPTPPELVERMLDLAHVGAADYLIDLGCGDGRIAIAAARRGARALGVDLDPERVGQAVAAASFAGLANLVRFRREDLFRTAIWEASVIALYLLPAMNLRLRPRLLTELRPGARVVSHNFDMGDWRPETDEHHEAGRLLLWTVPAVAGGGWRMNMADGGIFALELEQRYQDVTGTMSGAGEVRELGNAVLRGKAFSFTAGGRAYAGTIEDAVMTGTDSAWRAVRTG